MHTRFKLFYLFLLSGLNSSFAQWEEINPGNTNAAHELECVNSTHCMMCTGENSIRKTTNGLTWSASDNGILSGDQIIELEYVSEDTVYLCGFNNSNSTHVELFFRSFNGGSSWERNVVTGAGLRKLNFINGQIGFASISNKIYKTTDSGANWTVVATHSIFMKAMHFWDENLGVAVNSMEPMDRRQIFRTTNGGLSWNLVYEATIPSFFSYYFNDIEMVSATVGYAAGANGYIVKTTNGGSSWSVVGNPYDGAGTKNFMALDFRDENNGYVVGTGGSILKTTNGGNNWTDETIGIDLLVDVSIASPDVVYIASSNNYRALKNTNANLGVELLQPVALEIYPNPIKDALLIKIDKNKTHFRLSDPAGKIIHEESLINNAINKINFPDLTPGLYVYEICDQNSTLHVGKLVKN